MSSNSYSEVILLAKRFFGCPIDEIMLNSKKHMIILMVKEMMKEQSEFYDGGTRVFCLFSKIRRNIEIVLIVLGLDLNIMEDDYDDDNCFVVYFKDELLLQLMLKLG